MLMQSSDTYTKTLRSILIHYSLLTFGNFDHVVNVNLKNKYPHIIIRLLSLQRHSNYSYIYIHLLFEKNYRPYLKLRHNLEEVN